MRQTNPTETPRAASQKEKEEVDRRMHERHPEGVAVLERPEESSWLQLLWSTEPIP
jgi:hypothetical protein